MTEQKMTKKWARARAKALRSKLWVLRWPMYRNVRINPRPFDYRPVEAELMKLDRFLLGNYRPANYRMAVNGREARGTGYLGSEGNARARIVYRFHEGRPMWGMPMTSIALMCGRYVIDIYEGAWASGFDTPRLAEAVEERKAQTTPLDPIKIDPDFYRRMKKNNPSLTAETVHRITMGEMDLEAMQAVDAEFAAAGTASKKM
jgi:hypothetical protein